MVFGDTEARDVLVTELVRMWSESEFKDIGLYHDNGPKPNFDAIDIFVQYEIQMIASKQMTLGEHPIDRTTGYIQFYLGIKEGKGIRKLLQIRDFIKQNFKAKVFQSLKTTIPSPGKKNIGNGWHIETLMIPFYFDGMPLTKKAP